MPATATTPALSKADQKKIGTYSFHAPADSSLFDPSAFGVISIFEYVTSKNGDKLKTHPVGKVRFERSCTDQAVKRAKAIVRDLNSGAGVPSTLFPPCGVVSVPTGRPRGRRPSIA
jgi:hypothetical protein